METTTNPEDAMFMVSVFDSINSEFYADTIEECWKWVNENVKPGDLYEIFDADDNMVEQARGV
jgi:hypothetical protein